MPTEISPQTNIRALVAEFPIAEDVLTQFGLHCAGCGVNKYETIEQGANAHGLRVQPIVAALVQARLSGRVPLIMNEDKTPARRAPGEFTRRARFARVVPVMSGKGGVGKSLTTALLAVGLRRAGKQVGILDADITGSVDPATVRTAHAARSRARSRDAARAAAAAADGSGEDARRDRSRELEPAHRQRGHRDDLARSDPLRRDPSVLRAGAVERPRLPADRSSAGDVGRAADRAAIAGRRRDRARDDAAEARDDDRPQSGESRPSAQEADRRRRREHVVLRRPRHRRALRRLRPLVRRRGRVARRRADVGASADRSESGRAGRRWPRRRDRRSRSSTGSPARSKRRWKRCRSRKRRSRSSERPRRKRRAARFS